MEKMLPNISTTFAILAPTMWSHLPTWYGDITSHYLSKYDSFMAHFTCLLLLYSVIYPVSTWEHLVFLTNSNTTQIAQYHLIRTQPTILFLHYLHPYCSQLLFFGNTNMHCLILEIVLFLGSVVFMSEKLILLNPFLN